MFSILLRPTNLLLLAIPAVMAANPPPSEPAPGREHHKRLRPMLQNNLDRPLRYRPEGGDFVIVNGAERFNRPLYGCSSIFRVDAGDQPEFSFYVPGRGGNLRLALLSGETSFWLDEAESIEARYRAGMMVYRIQDARLGKEPIEITALATRGQVGFLLEVRSAATAAKFELLVAFGGADGGMGGRGGDIGCESVPSREFFAFEPSRCKGNRIATTSTGWSLVGKRETITAVLPDGSASGSGDAGAWTSPSRLFASLGKETATPVALSRVVIAPGQALHLGFFLGAKAPGGEWSAPHLAKQFQHEHQQQLDLAGRVRIDTPDPFINAAMPALNVAADAVWDEKNQGYLHGAVAWRVLLLGWRAPYVGDTLGWHERTRAHFDRFAKKQNTKPIPAQIPGPDANHNLSRSMNAIHSNGDLSHSAYDMNTVAVDAILRHLMWTGDLTYARSIWPVLERHMAWSKRLFRREFGPQKLPIYDSYCQIWASDAVAYHGGGVAHGSAYAYFHNVQMTRLAQVLGVDGSIYQQEADLIAKGIRQHLWLQDRGWFAEYKDLLGEQLVHPEAAAWTFYHAVDSHVPSPFEAWQMGRAVETRLPHFPVRGPNVPPGGETIATSTWAPYEWSINNVVMAETMHTALSLWQSGRNDHALRLFQGALLDSMFLGICPGNVGMCTWFDVNRRESQRDFADATGVLSRTIVEGLFGVTPDLLGGQLRLQPRFPYHWPHASIQHPSFDFSLKRSGHVDTYHITQRFSRTVPVTLTLPARCASIQRMSLKGTDTKVAWQVLADAVGTPQVLVSLPAAVDQQLEIEWAGTAPSATPKEVEVREGETLTLTAGAPILAVEDPQGALAQPKTQGERLAATAVGTPGHRTVFAKVRQDQLEWWQPLSLNILPSKPTPHVLFTTDWTRRSSGKHEMLPLDASFNEDLNQIFKREYLSPRAPVATLSIPKQGFGSWCHSKGTFSVDDSGLRAKAAEQAGKLILPNGVPIATPTTPAAPNVAIVSQWDQHPRKLELPLSGTAKTLYLLMAGTTNGMQSRIENAELIVTYQDGSQCRVGLDNPGSWWPIHTDYFIDDFAFRRPGPLPLRVDLKSGNLRVLSESSFVGKGTTTPGGAATVIDVKLDSTKPLKSLTVRAVANQVLIGLMGATLERPE